MKIRAKADQVKNTQLNSIVDLCTAEDCSNCTMRDYLWRRTVNVYVIVTLVKFCITLEFLLTPSTIG